MKAGASYRDVTLPDFLQGRPNVHDSLYARVLVLDDGEDTVAIICLDMVDPFFPEVRKKIQERLGIEHTFINCIHTHSDARGGRKENWAEKVGEAIWEAVEEAHANRVPVSLHAGRAPVQIGYNRRSKRYTEAVVPWVNVLQARNENGKPLAVLFEHAAHPVITLECGAISADYPAYAVQRINEALGDEVMPLFGQGCCGNINGYPVGFTMASGWHQRAEEAGRKLGDAVLAGMAESTEIKTDKFKVRTERTMLPCRLPTMDGWVEMATRLMRQSPFKPLPGDEAPNGTHDSWVRSLDLVKGMIERGEKPEVEFGINGVMLGSEWCLVTMPSEMFCEYELWIDENAPFDHKMVFGYTNAGLGYIPTDKALVLGVEDPLDAESECNEAASWPAFFEGIHIRGARLPYAPGTERAIHEAIASLWAK